MDSIGKDGRPAPDRKVYSRLKDVPGKLQGVVRELLARGGMTPRQMARFKLDDPQWYWRRTWSVADSAAFVDWLAAELRTDKELWAELAPSYRCRNKKNARGVAEHFNWNFGWRLETLPPDAPGTTVKA